MSELENHFKHCIFNTRIAFVDARQCERGVFATKDIAIGEYILRMPLSDVIIGTKNEVTKKLMESNTVYVRSLPYSTSNFPVTWNENMLIWLKDSAIRPMISSRKQSLLRENTDGKDSMFLHYRLLVGSRAFAFNDKLIGMVPYGDMLNHSNDPNISWKFTDKHFVMRATKNIKKGQQCFDSYGTKTNYESSLFYGMTMDDWKANHQTDASSAQQSDFKQAFAQNVTDKS